MSGQERGNLLESLVEYKEPPISIVKRLEAFAWDSAEPLILLRRSDIEKVLRRFCESQISREEVYAWADAIELREDIGYPPDVGQNLRQAIHELANPVLEGELTLKSARDLMSRLGLRIL